MIDANLRGSSWGDPINLLLTPMGFELDKKNVWVTRIGVMEDGPVEGPS